MERDKAHRAVRFPDWAIALAAKPWSRVGLETTEAARTWIRFRRPGMRQKFAGARARARARKRDISPPVRVVHGEVVVRRAVTAVGRRGGRAGKSWRGAREDSACPPCGFLLTAYTNRCTLPL